ncbi:MAG: LuxR C-terminal-related transcriptional regulator [Parvularculaceae bacterium]|nr:hypothetical protein [Caulobacterales bacterium]
MNRNWIIETKLCAPHRPGNLVARKRLSESFARWKTSKLGLVIAPAGYGKTSLLTDWCERWRKEGALVAWLTLDENDSDALRLTSYIIAAFSSAGVPLDRLEFAAHQGLADTPIEAAFASLINHLAECRREMVLVLEDYHRLHSPEADKLIDALVASAPDNVHVFISSRERPKVMQATYRARDQLIEVSPEDLKFTKAEARDLFGQSIAPTAIESLIEQTEGWAVALQLAKLWCEDRQETPAPSAADLLWAGNVADYFAEQILYALEPSLQEFLLKTSILERINADLANTVCGRSDCGQLLSNLHRLHALILPIDKNHHWFRCHQLFGDFLRRTLEKERPRAIPALHAAASEWFEKEGFIVEAVLHAKAAGDVDRAADIVLSAGGWRLIIESGVALTSSLLQQFSADEIGRYPRLQICQSYMCMKTGDIARGRALIEALRPQFGEHAPPTADPITVRDFDHVDGLLYRYQDLPVTYADLAILREKANNANANDPVDVAVRLTELCLTPLVLGDFAAAQAVSAEAIRYMQSTGQVLAFNYCYFHVGMASYGAFNFHEAEATFIEAQALAEENYGSDSGLKNIADCMLAVMRAERDDNEAAEKLLSGALSVIERHDSWMEVLAATYQAAASVAYSKDGPEGVLAVLARGEATAKRRGMTRLLTYMLAERARWLVHFEALDEAKAALNDPRLMFTLGSWRQEPYQWRRHQTVGFAKVRLMLATRQPEGAYEILDDIEQSAVRGGRHYDAAQAKILRAVFMFAAGDELKAAGELLKVLSVAAPQNARRIFLEMPPEIEDLLRLCRQQSKLRGSGSFVRTFIEDLLEARRARRMRHQVHQRIDLLSAREREVLSELCNGARNKEIARALDMTENTVKFHLKNIFAKLGVDNRAEAVAVARERSLA